MAETDTRSIKVLFREWRQGDAEAGQIMAQRFADWYYAIATSRLGEDAGREPCETACRKYLARRSFERSTTSTAKLGLFCGYEGGCGRGVLSSH